MYSREQSTCVEAHSELLKMHGSHDKLHANIQTDRHRESERERDRLQHAVASLV